MTSAAPKRYKPPVAQAALPESPKGQIADERRDEKGNRKGDQHRMQRVSGYLRRRFGVAVNHGWHLLINGKHKLAGTTSDAFPGPRFPRGNLGEDKRPEERRIESLVDEIEAASQMH